MCETHHEYLREYDIARAGQKVLCQNVLIAANTKFTCLVVNFGKFLMKNFQNRFKTLSIYDYDI